MIKNIEISKLKAHPNNPRKVIGDVSELAASIKKNGVFQNLTVVPNEDDTYTIIIGHRRHAAAKEAGLTELPCAVIEMTEKEQLSTMLLENMQREDLTVLEQAEGFQMMIDLGESVKSISEQTGFSQSTVRHRVKLLELDRNILEKQGREIPITTYIKLEQIKDIDRRNKVLQAIGTNNFEWELRRAIDDEKREKGKKYWATRLADMEATDISKVNRRWEKYQAVCWFKYTDKVDDVLKKLPEEPFFYALESNYCDIYEEKVAVKEEPDDEETLARKKAEQKRQENNDALESIKEMCRESVLEFCHSFKTRNINDGRLIFQLFLLIVFTTGDYNHFDLTSVIEEEKLDEIDEKDDLITLSDFPVVKDVPAALLAIVVDAYEDFDTFDYYNYYEEDEALLAIYDCIKTLGYEASDEECAYINGTHELYKKKEEME